MTLVELDRSEVSSNRNVKTCRLRGGTNLFKLNLGHYLDVNPGPMVSQATAIPTVLQPLSNLLNLQTRLMDKKL